MSKLKNFKYRKEMTVNHTDDGAQSNYQLNLIVHRTTGTDGETEYFGPDATYFGQPGISVTGGADVPIYPYTYPVYCSFLNAYGVWTNQDYVSPVGTWVTVNYTTTIANSAGYTLICSADNHIRVVIGGSTVGVNDNWGTTNSSYVYLTAGSKTITCTALNDGGPASFAAALYAPDGTVVWHTRMTTTTTVNNSNNVVYVSTKCKSDFSDIRFTKSDGVTLLDYWIESYDSTQASIWVEFDTIPAHPNNGSYYMYYGHYAASSLSSIDNTMITGLRYFYYSTNAPYPPSYGPPTSSTYRGTSVDTSIYHHWESGWPVPGPLTPISINGLSWEIYNPASLAYYGWIKNSGTGWHTIYCASDDGQRLYLPNTTLVLDDWMEQGITEESVAHKFSSPVRMKYEYYSNGGGPEDIQLGWTPPGGSKTYPIPSAYLRCTNHTPVAPAFGPWGLEEKMTPRPVIF